MAEVHDGWDTRLARPVAIKILHPGFGSEPDNRRRFEAEARAAAALNDAHIVAVASDGAQVVAPGSLRVSLPSERCVWNATMINATPERCPVRVGGNGDSDSAISMERPLVAQRTTLRARRK